MQRGNGVKHIVQGVLITGDAVSHGLAAQIDPRPNAAVVEPAVALDLGAGVVGEADVHRSAVDRLVVCLVPVVQPFRLFTQRTGLNRLVVSAVLFNILGPLGKEIVRVNSIVIIPGVVIVIHAVIVVQGVVVICVVVVILLGSVEIVVIVVVAA